MNDAARVRVREPGADLGHQPDDPIERKRAARLEGVGQARSVEMLHREVEKPVGLLPEVEDPHQVLMVEAARGERLRVEAPAEFDVVLEAVVEDLHCDGDPEIAVRGAIHGADAAGADHAFDLQLSTGKRTAQEGVGGELDVLPGELARMALRERDDRGNARTKPTCEGRHRGRRIARRYALVRDRLVRIVHPQAQRKADLSRNAERFGEEHERIGGVGGVDLEEVRRGRHRRRQERKVGRSAGERAAGEEVPRGRVGEIGDEHGPDRG